MSEVARDWTFKLGFSALLVGAVLYLMCDMITSGSLRIEKPTTAATVVVVE